MDSDEIAKAAAPKLDLDELMERIRAEVSERKRLSGAPTPPAETAIPEADFAAHRWTARQLLALPASEFVRAVHLAFLGRDPMPEEFVRLRDRLLVSHVGRMRVLREFGALPEARARRLSVEGFWRESARDRLYWSPPAKFGRFLGRLVGNTYRTPRRIREYIARIEMLERRAAEAAAAIRTVRQNADKQVRQLREHLAATKQAQDTALAARAGAIEHKLVRQAHDLSAEIEALVLDIRTSLVDHQRAILDQKLRMETFLSTEQPDISAKEASRSVVAEEKSHLLDPLYLSFEDRYRGTRDDIKDRQQIYVPRIAACVAATGHGPVIDIGCGRGEWLELLTESGIAARGCDLNRIAVEECRQRGLDANMADAVHVLATMPDNACSAITAFHVVEHIGFEMLVTLLDHSLRVLKPGGLLVLETPNPANVIVAAEKFYFDPTHRNPLPSELTTYLLKSRGFENVEVLPLHPVDWSSRTSYEDPMLTYLQDKLFGPQDYAVIGRKAA
ncbi:MAG: class I SAM-dependent methyltransferase [Rhizomicrobium sp.]